MMGEMYPEVDLKGCPDAAAHQLATDVLYLAKHAHVKALTGRACSRADQAMLTSAAVFTLLRRSARASGRQWRLRPALECWS